MPAYFAFDQCRIYLKQETALLRTFNYIHLIESITKSF